MYLDFFKDFKLKVTDLQSKPVYLLMFRFVADYRPFYTIHDADFKEMTASNCSALPAIILGVTNPFFNKVK